MITRSPRRQWLLLFATLACLVLAPILLWRSINGPPFVMKVRPNGDTAIIQFIQPDSRSGTLVSPEFTIPVSVERATITELESRHIDLPVGVIEHGDTTVTPGHFSIRFGDKVLDVMEARTVEEGISYDWQPQPKP